MISLSRLLSADKPRPDKGGDQAALRRYRHLHISPEFRFIYVSNPKVACSSTKASLNLEVAARQGIEHRIESMEQIHSRQHNPLLMPRQLGRKRFEAMLHDPDVLRFSFVRDPVARFCSAYMSKLDEGKRGSGMAQRLWAHMGWPKDYPLTLEEFGELCAADPTIRDFDPHWMLQRSRLFFDEFDYGFIGRHESFDQDFCAVSRRIFGAEIEIFDTRETFHRVTGGNRKAREVSDSLRRNVETAYAGDFEMIEQIGLRGLDRH